MTEGLHHGKDDGGSGSAAERGFLSFSKAVSRRATAWAIIAVGRDQLLDPGANQLDRPLINE